MGAVVAGVAAIAIALVGWMAAPVAAWAGATGSEVGAAASEPEGAATGAATYPAKTPATGPPAGAPASPASVLPAASAGPAGVPASPAATTPAAASAKPAAKTPAELAAERKAREEAARELAKTRMAAAARRPKTEFENTPVEDALKTLADAGRFPIVIDPALKEAGIDLAARTVSLKATGLSYEDVLNLVLPRETGYRVEAGYVLVTTLEKSWLPLKVMVYSLKLATAEIPDFTNAPRFNIAEAVRNRQGGQGGGGTLFGAPAAAAPEVSGRATPERIIAMLKQFVQSANDRRIAPWDDVGGPATIQQIGLQIVVTQTDAGQRAVARVLVAIE